MRVVFPTARTRVLLAGVVTVTLALGGRAVGAQTGAAPSKPAVAPRATPAAAGLNFTVPFIMAERIACPLVAVYLQDIKTRKRVGGWFLVDTGSEGSYVSDAFAKRLSLPRTGITLPQKNKEPVPYEVAPNVRFHFGNLNQTVSLIVINPSVKSTQVLAELANAIPVDGVLGTNFLNNFSVLLDNQAQTLSFLREKIWTSEELARNGFTNESRAGVSLGEKPLYKVTVMVEQEAVTLAVDTGGYRTMLPGRFARAYKSVAAGKETEKSMAHTVDIRLVRVPSLTVGGQVLRDRVFGALSRSKDDGDLTLILGQDVFSRMDKILFDFPQHKLYLQKSDDSVNPYPTAASQENAVRLLPGFQIKPNAHGEWRLSETPIYLLRDTDLRGGDLLTAIAGVPLRDQSPDEVAQKLRDVRDGQTITLLRRTDSQAPLLEVTVKVGAQPH